MKEVIKETLGDRARDIIVQDLGLKFNGNHYSCPYPDHNDEHPWQQTHGDTLCQPCRNSLENDRVLVFGASRNGN